MPINNDFLVPAKRRGPNSGAPSIETRRLNQAVEDNWNPLRGVIKIDRAEIKAAFPTITDAMLTKDFAFDFIKGGLPLVAGTGAQAGTWYFDSATVLTNPIKIVSDNGLGNSANRQRLLTDLVDDGISYYIKADNFGNDRISLLGKQAVLSMKTDLKNLEPADYTKTAILAADLKKPDTITGDYQRVDNLPVRATAGYFLGVKVKFKFSTVAGAEGWVVIPDKTTPAASGWYIVSIPNTTLDINGVPLQSFDTVQIRYKEVEAVAP